MRRRLIESAAVLAALALLGSAVLEIGHQWRVFFGWPTGGIWSNLVASALLGGPALWALVRNHRRDFLGFFTALDSRIEAKLAAHHQPLHEAIAQVHSTVHQVHGTVRRLNGESDD